jgi:plastocyanin
MMFKSLVLLFFSFLTFTAPFVQAEDDTVQLKLVIQDGKFDPAELKAPAGKRIELMVENRGPGAEEFESKELKREKVIPVGQTMKITLGVLKKGKYKFFGEYHAETANGVLVIE